MEKLNLGCGYRKISGYIGIDINPSCHADVIHDLNSFPYPFADNQFREILCDNVIEHLNDIIPVLEELYRITMGNGTIIIKTPHYTNYSSFSDPTHKHHLSSFSFDSDTLELYTGKTFDASVEVKLRGFWQLLGFGLLVNNSRSIQRFWESYLSFVIRATTVIIVLKPIKTAA